MKAYVFPGQGAQFTGMGKDVYEASATARELFERANEILGFDITKIMFEGTAEELKETKVTQPAIFLHSVALFKALGAEAVPQMVAGHSLGEISALVANGVLSFEDGLRLVSQRAQAMQKACDHEPSTMAAILGLEDELVESVCADVDGVVVAANAPRRYVKLARTSGFDRIDSLPEERRSLVDYPAELSGGRYRERFWEFAAHHEDSGEEEIDVTTIDPDDPLLPMYRSQQTWDATMAQSIINTKPSTERKVLLLVEQFHVEYDGGIVQELRKRMPRASVLVISIQREFPEEDWQGTPPIADIMVVESLK